MTKPDVVKTQIRLPADLHAELQAAAEESGRSFNAEMVTRLRLGLSAMRVWDAGTAAKQQAKLNNVMLRNAVGFLNEPTSAEEHSNWVKIFTEMADEAARSIDEIPFPMTKKFVEAMRELEKSLGDDSPADE